MCLVHELLELRYPRRLAFELAVKRLAERVELGLSVPTHPSPVPRYETSAAHRSALSS